MPRTLRLLFVLLLPALLVGVPAGLMLGSFATGEAPPTRLAGFMLPTSGSEGRSVSAADFAQPADVAYIPDDRYVQASQRWAD